MTPPEVALESMHETYNRLTGQNLKFKPFERLWWSFQKAGYTSADLELTVNYIHARNRRDTYKISLRLNLLLDDLARFESYRGEADLQAREKQARARAWKPTPGESARASMCRHDPVPPTKEPIMARDAVLAGLETLRKNLSQA